MMPFAAACISKAEKAGPPAGYRGFIAYPGAVRLPFYFTSFCMPDDSQQSDPLPVSRTEQQNKQVADNRQRYSGFQEVFHRKRPSTVSEHILRRADRQQEAETDDELLD